LYYKYNNINVGDYGDTKIFRFDYYEDCDEKDIDDLDNEVDIDDLKEKINDLKERIGSLLDRFIDVIKNKEKDESVNINNFINKRKKDELKKKRDNNEEDVKSKKVKNN